MVSRNRQCSDNDGITTRSRCLFEKTLMIFGPILIYITAIITYYLCRVNEGKAII